MSKCLKRSFEAGLRWCGIEDEVPNIIMSEDARDLAESYGLTWICGTLADTKNDPVIVIYMDDMFATDSKYHAVFVSDLAPFAKFNSSVYAVITGFVELRERTINNNG